MPHPASAANDFGLTICLLGGCRISVGARVIEPSSWRLRKAETLIKLLALAPDHRLHHEQLQELLWPDLEATSAANNLYKALHVARRMLEPNPSSPSGYLQRQGELIGLAPSTAVWIDVEAFETALAAARRTSEPAAYWTAIGLYGGDLLPEDRYEEWAADRRERLRRTYTASLIEVARLHEDRREYERAIEALQRVVESDQADEEAHAGLMRVYALAGQRHQSLRQYEHLKAALQRELDAEPSAESTHLYREILSGRFPDRGASGDQDRLEATVDGDSSPVLVRDNLPCPLTGFIGREREKTEVERLLRAARLVTLTGAGGCGKSRLALEVAGRLRGACPDGVWLVELSGLADPALVPQSIASVFGVWGEPGRPLVETLSSHLQQRRLLLLLDNCEHVVECCAAVADGLLRACPELRIMATSRQALGIAGEIDWRVPSLAVPDPAALASLEVLARYEAVQLFLDRAQSSRPGFDLTSQNAARVAQICFRLDGMPLAIELAAARVKALSVEDIAARLDDRFQLLTCGSRTAPRRQQTLRATVDWSYDLLSPDEQVLFARLSVFAGGWALEAAEVVCGDDDAAGRRSLVRRSAVLNLLSQLVDKSLVIAEASAQGTVRYRLLETVRQYGQDRLTTSGGIEAVRGRHADYYVALAEKAEGGLAGAGQAEWLDRLEHEHDNLRAALEWSKADARRCEAGMRLAAGIWRFWWLRGYLAEGRGHLDALMARSGESVPNSVRAKALHALGVLAFRQGHYALAWSSLEQSLAIAEAAGDRRGMATALRSVGRMAIDQGDPATARRVLERSLAIEQELGNASGAAWSRNYLGLLAHFEGDNASARSELEAIIPTLRRLDDRWGVAVSLCYLGHVAFDDDNATARGCWLESLEICRAERYLWCIPYLLEGFGSLAAAEAQPIRAVRLVGAAASLHETIGAPRPPIWRADVRRRLTPARRALDEVALAAATAEGRAMTLDQAIAYALS